MKITNEQKRELSNIPYDFDLKITDFKIDGKDSEFFVKYKKGPYSFLITKNNIAYYSIKFFPVDVIQGIEERSVEWEYVKKYFKGWMKGISEEENTDIGWETEKDENFLDSDPNDFNTPFTEIEKSNIKVSIKEVKIKLTILQLEKTKLDSIENKLDELSLKLDELNKFDWKSFFIGTVANLIMTLLIPPDKAGSLWTIIKSCFGKVRIE